MADHTAAQVLTYGVRGEVRVHDLVLDELARPRFGLDTPWGAHEVRLSVSGEHMAANAAAAIAVVGSIEGRVDAAVQALEHAAVSPMRMEVRRAPGGAIVVNDSYNANPDSMRAALDAVARMSATRRLAVLGPMAELDDPAEGHRRVMADATERGIEVIAVDTELYGIPAAADPLGELGELGPGDVVLVKASRVGGLEHVAAALLSS
jgi:UDP-N-acetylmuramoyl-tripeptide--D-alanyl-D-alanine ligase